MSSSADLLTVESSDDVSVVVHDLSPGVQARPLLISHATGFCGHAYAPIARALGDRFRCLAIDHRGHGETAAPPGWEAGEGVDWARFGDDTLAVARVISSDGNLVGFGHSMGATSLLMAAHRDPNLFDRLVLFEPIAARPAPNPSDTYWLPIVAGARRRRRRFDSFDQAYDNFSGKPPLSQMTPEALRAYVQHALRPAVDGGVELCCSPELEAAIFMFGHRNGAWELLPDIDVPVLVITGVVEANEPSFWAEIVAERLPNGELVVLPHQTHFGPFSHPDEVAALIAT